MERKGTLKAKRRRKRQRNRRIFCGMMAAAALLLFACYKTSWFTHLPGKTGNRRQVKKLEKQILDAEDTEYPDELAELLEQNEETYDFVKDYPNRDAYKGKAIDLTEDLRTESVPLLMQWDKRWGYDMYGDSMIAIDVCGPACMTMAYLYYTEDASMNPKKMAELAQESGYHSQEGTSWDFWTMGARQRGLYGEELSLSEHAMKNVLDGGGLIVCSMSPGDFTTGGHYILVRGYDAEGFLVNDPNRLANSEKKWEYETLAAQMKNLWAIYGG